MRAYRRLAMRREMIKAMAVEAPENNPKAPATAASFWNDAETTRLNGNDMEKNRIENRTEAYAVSRSIRELRTKSNVSRRSVRIVARIGAEGASLKKRRAISRVTTRLMRSNTA